MESLENIEPNMLRILSPFSSDKLSTPIIKTPSSSTRKGRTLSTASGEGAVFESPFFEESYDTAHEHSGSKMRSANRSAANFSATWSPTLQKAHTMLQSKIEHDRMKQELVEKEKVIKQQKDLIESLLKEKKLTEERENMFTEDIQVKEFFISLQEQKISELEEEASSRRLQHHEAASKLKKYKANIKKLEYEKQSFENKSKNMMNQLNEQMAQLQSFALERIQVLENEIMQARHENDQLKSQVSQLKKQQVVREDYFEPRRNRPARKVISEDLITEDNYLDLNTSTFSHCSVATEVQEEGEGEESLVPEELLQEDVEEGEDIEETEGDI